MVVSVRPTVDVPSVDERTGELHGPADLVARTVEEAPSPAPRASLVLCHANPGAEHLLGEEGALTGVLDWGDGCLTDRAVDFARILRDFGPHELDQLLSNYHPPDAVDRRSVTFFARCAALEDLHFGQRTGNVAYEVAARRRLAWLF